MSYFPSHGLLALLAKLELRTSFNNSDRDALLALPETVRTLRRHEFIARDQENVRDCCVLIAGFAIRHKVAGNGLRQIFSIHMKGDPVDLHNSMLGTADHNLQMVSDGRATFIPIDAIRELTLAFPTVGQAMWQETLVEAAIFREWTLNIGRRDARSRMAHLLCELAVRTEQADLGTAENFEMPMTQEELGDALTMTPIHVSRTLKILATDGLISREKRSIRILDRYALTKLGDFDSAYLRLTKDSDADELASVE